MNNNVLLRCLAASATLALAGCSPTLTLVSPAPPNRVITVDREHDAVEISEGVAVAVECHGDGGPCDDMKAVSSSPDILGVYPAHIAKIDRSVYDVDSSAANLAIVGIKPGRTTLRVWSGGHTSEYTVTVLPVEGVSQGAVAR